MGLNDDGFDNPYDRAMAKRSEEYRYYRYSFPEPPPPRCCECDNLISEDEYDNPMPVFCSDCANDEEEARHARGES